MTPKSAASRVLRDQTLDLARTAPFARALVNSGRLSVPAHLTQSELNTPDDEPWRAGAVAPGSAAIDAPIRQGGRSGWWLEALGGRFVVLTCPAPGAEPPHRLELGGEAVDVLALGRDIDDVEGQVAARYDLRPGSTLLFRPDQHLAMRCRTFDAAVLGQAMRRSLALEPRAAHA